jgi:hypothetical protein
MVVVVQQFAPRMTDPDVAGSIFADARAAE